MSVLRLEKNQYYDENYYTTQRDTGAYSASIDIFKFNREIGAAENLLDFGCGGGFILDRLVASNKIGIEVNPAAAREARQKGIKVFDDLEAVEDNWADVAISHHALEHVDNPLDVVVRLRAKLKPGGKLVIVTPSETYAMRYREADVNFHLFTWSPSNLGNLLKRAGFEAISSEPIFHRWPPFWYILKDKVPLRAMHMMCVMRGRLDRRYCQVKAIGFKPSASGSGCPRLE